MQEMHYSVHAKLEFTIDRPFIVRFRYRMSFFLVKFVKSRCERDPMRWKDFLYFRKGSKIGVTLLLILILLTLILNILLSYRDSSGIVVVQNDSIAQAFDEFLKTLKTSDPSPSPSESDPDFSRPSVRESEKNLSERKSTRKEGSSSYSRTTPLDSENKSEDTGNMEDYAHYPRVEKLTEGETISLNASDTADWKKIPGIGEVYSARIVEYRDRLGGFARKEQLMEVYGIDDELYARIAPYIETSGSWKKMAVNNLEFKELLSHPYLSYKQVQAIMNLRRRKGDIVSIQELGMLDEFTSEDIYRLEPYLEF